MCSARYTLYARVPFPTAAGENVAQRVYHRMNEVQFWHDVNPRYSTVQEKGKTDDGAREILFTETVCGCCRTTFPAFLGFREEPEWFVLDFLAKAGFGVRVHHVYRVRKQVVDRSEDKSYVEVVDEVEIEAPKLLLGYVMKTARAAHEDGIKRIEEYPF